MCCILLHGTVLTLAHAKIDRCNDDKGCLPLHTKASLECAPHGVFDVVLSNISKKLLIHQRMMKLPRPPSSLFMFQEKSFYGVVDAQLNAC
jgi:hypothetical protein